MPKSDKLGVSSERTSRSDKRIKPNEPQGRGGTWPMSLLVFSAGGVLMSLEIVGSRILAPYFGNSVFVWGSLITIFLIAISMGNYAGGLIADRVPNRATLGFICVASALVVVGTAFAAHPLCQFILASGGNNQAGPLIASLLLFLPPSIGLSMVTPFAIRVGAHNIESLGQHAGGLYALSTIGSIAGTLITTFVLIPMTGVSTIVIGIGGVLLVISLLMFAWGWRTFFGSVGGAVFIATSFLLADYAELSHASGPGERVLLNVNTAYHNIAVVDNDLRGSRELRFDHYVESAISRDIPYRSLAEYTNYFSIAFLLKPTPSNCLFIGAGGGIGPRVFHDHSPATTIDLVDIDAEVIEISKKYFYLEDGPYLHSFAEDGRMFLQRSDARYDIVILDAFTIGGRIPFHLATKEFFALCRSRMTADGVFMININSAQEGPRAGIYDSLKATMDSVFDDVHVFAVGRDRQPPTSTINILLLGTASQKAVSPEEWRTLANAYRSDSYVTPAVMHRMLDDLVPNAKAPAGAKLFTDDLSAIESMPF